jgi:pimeloyl-ACP methyl ester carboxylesterase
MIRLRRAPVVVVLAAALATGACIPSSWLAGGILHPARRPVMTSPSLPYREVTVSGDPVLRGWLIPATAAPRRGLLVYLHGVADNRQSGLGLASRYTARGWDVLVYDSRAHGRSDGKACTYGFHERHDVGRVLDAAGARKAVLLGCSMGAAVALQAAAVEPRIRAVVAVSPFATLERVLRERARSLRLVSETDVVAAIALAEKQGAFRAGEVSPVAAAARLLIPVLVVHGEADTKIVVDHGRQVHAALAGPRRLVIVPRAGHDDILSYGESWAAIDGFLDEIGLE